MDIVTLDTTTQGTGQDAIASLPEVKKNLRGKQFRYVRARFDQVLTMAGGAAAYALTRADVLAIMRRSCAAWTMYTGAKGQSDEVDQAIGFDRLRRLGRMLAGREVQRINNRTLDKYQAGDITVPLNGTITIRYEYVRPLWDEGAGEGAEEECPGATQMAQLQVDIRRDSPTAINGGLVTLGTATVVFELDGFESDVDVWARLPRSYRTTLASAQGSSPPGHLIGLFLAQSSTGVDDVGVDAANAIATLLLAGTKISLHTVDGYDLYTSTRVDDVIRAVQLMADPSTEEDIQLLGTCLYRRKELNAATERKVHAGYILEQMDVILGQPIFEWIMQPLVDDVYRDSVAAPSIHARALGGAPAPQFKLTSAPGLKGGRKLTDSSALHAMAILLPGDRRQHAHDGTVHTAGERTPTVDFSPATIAAAQAYLASFAAHPAAATAAAGHIARNIARKVPGGTTPPGGASKTRGHVGKGLAIHFAAHRGGAAMGKMAAPPPAHRRLTAFEAASRAIED